MAIMASLEVKACGVEDSTQEYNYDDIGDNWQVEDFFAPVCLSGREQSPIDLPTDGGVGDDTLTFTISEHQDYTEEDEKVIKRKTHTLEIDIEDGALDIVSQLGEEDRFTTVQFHAHSPSEHT